MLTPLLAVIGRGGGFGPGPIFPLLMLLLLGGLAVWFIRRRNGGPDRDGSAMATLENRFARGEINQAEFAHRKAVLVGADAVPPVPDAAPPVTEPTEADE